MPRGTNFGNALELLPFPPTFTNKHIISVMPNILPASLTSLLGRKKETANLRQLLRSLDVRLVTITGPGGVGKTSLALQVAHDLQDAFVDGVFFISLAAISDSSPRGGNRRKKAQ